MVQGSTRRMKCIQILMGVCNGASYLPAQLDSLAAQDLSDWRLLASDDSTNDASRRVIEKFQADQPQQVEIIQGPRQGFAANYLSLLRQAEPGPLAFADQDDVWISEKLSRAATALHQVSDGHPALYCARVQPWDSARGTLQRPMPALSRPPSLRNALIENVAAGNTIVLNSAAAELARELAAKTPSVFAHDWWLYQVIIGAGGTVLHDSGPPVVQYRQHSGNVMGSGRGFAAQVRRKKAVLQRAFADRLTQNAAALQIARDHLTPENALLFDAFEAARASSGLTQLREFSRLGIYRQSRVGTAGFLGAAALGLV